MDDDIAVPAVTDPRWRLVALGKINGPWATLALKILMSRILRETIADSSSTNVQRCVNEIRAFFIKNAKIARRDLTVIFH